ncbi:DDE-type integrase/transposase/recombinase [uncultured Lutibacter sp.]|uniref:DDE-type integrase/transposase/recombinase n=1 Tax=uncultured Lutibacter sp. TaxID=437739 RepID=UPI002631BCD0|nr:DDE-type integrase/transposase/recombinase [uncultured Lutibacter sp.]
MVTSYFQLCETFHSVISSVKGIKTIIRKHCDPIVNTIESVKEFVSIDLALKVFNISRSSFEHYKNRILYSCDGSYFNWCVKKHPNQLLAPEIITIKKYMTDDVFKHWSKSSVYLKVVRDGKLFCSLATFYKYCSLLGFPNTLRKRKADFYSSFKSHFPNQLWCADVTIFKTLDGTKFYLHFLMDHYSKMILGYKIEKSSSAKAIKDLLSMAYHNYKPNEVQFLTDGGTENVNNTVCNFLNSLENPIQHLIAQKTVTFSNSMIEAFNRTLKHQFLYPKHPNSKKQLEIVLQESIETYNNRKPQLNLGGNTP